MPKAAESQVRRWDRDNLACARIVLAEPERYPGMQEWARAVVEKERNHDRQVDRV